jgi:hypothetical protein
MKTELARPAAFPEPRPLRVEVRETHASCVFLGADDVYKVKKPVDFGFLDFRTIEKRKSACDAEIELNRRLAADVYLGVVPVVCRRGGALAFGGEGALVDWAVHMRRMPDEERADVRLAKGTLEAAAIDAMAERIASFHATTRCDEQTSAFGTPAAIATNVVENFAQTRDRISEHLSASEAAEIESWQLSFLRDGAQLFQRRIDARRVRDGHGDLRLEHFYIDASRAITVLDCIEFNERFRFADVCADVSFLAMDLAWHGRADLAERFLASYARASGDYGLYEIVDFYESYRAYVRGKIATLLAHDPSADEAVRGLAAQEARRYFLLALAAHRRPLLRPILVCVGGIIASGKSTVAQAIAHELDAPVVEADLTRKQMLGVEPHQRVNEPAWKGAYEPAFTERVYAEVLQRAGAVLGARRAVVIDASFRSERQRTAARELARALGVPIRFVECRVDEGIARVRLTRREREGAISDGRLAIFDDFCARFEPMRELPPSEHVVVDTAQELARSLDVIRTQVATWPRGLYA